MAINPETQYPGKIAPSTPDYPYGAARNITIPGDGTGTPWEAALVNDLFGFQQSLLSEAAIVPSGTPEKVGASQYLDALRKITTTKVATVAALAALSLDAGGVVITNEYRAGAGVGSGMYRIVDPGDFSGTPDEVGDHTLANGNIAELIKGPFVDMRQYGADGTETNDTAALSVMATATVNCDVPEGTFLITPDVVTATSGWAVRGAGARAKLELQDFGKLITGNAVSDLSFTNVHLTTKDTLTPTDEFGSRSWSLHFTNCNTITVQGCFVSRNFGSQLRFQGCRGCVIDGNTLFEGKVTLPATDPGSSRSYYPASGADITFYGSDVAPSQGQFGKSVISNNLCFSNKDIGIDCNQLGGDGRISITGNVVTTLQAGLTDWADAATLNRRHGIIIGYNGPEGETDASGNGIVVTGNSISNTLWTGVYAQDGELTAAKRGNVITGNHIFKIGRALSYYGNLLGSIFLVNAANGTVITNNVIEDFQGEGDALGAIRLSGSTTAVSEVLITGNIINGCKAQGIKLGANQVNALISDNIIKNCDEHLISVNGSTSEFIIDGNKLEVTQNKRAISFDDNFRVGKISNNYIKYNSVDTSTEGAIYVRKLGDQPDDMEIDHNTVEGAFFSGVDGLSFLTAGRNWWPIKDNLFKDCLSAFEGLPFAQRCFVFNNRYNNTPKHTNGVIANRIYDASIQGDRLTFKAQKGDIAAWSTTLWVAQTGDMATYMDTVSAGSVGAVFNGTTWIEF